MNAAVFAAWLWLAQGTGTPAPQTATYTNDYLGISITHPASWSVAPKKSDAWITFPLKDGSSVAAVNVMAAVYFADTEIWQKSQEHINKQMELEVVRQWQEEILGVPLLLTKVRSGPGKLASAIKAVPKLPSDQPLVTLTGLLYTRTARKLLFRLTAPESEYDEAEYAWRQALESLRTTSGELPQPEDPKRTPEVVPPIGSKPEKPPTKTQIGAGAKPTDSPAKVRAQKLYEAAAAGRKIAFYFPEGWTVEAVDGGALKLKGTDPAVELSLGLFSTLDSDPPFRALLKASSANLKAFDKVDSRDESEPKDNKAGAKVIRIWRTGTSAAGPVWTFEAAGGNNDYYFLLTLRGTGRPDPAVMKALETLLSQASVEPMG